MAYTRDWDETQPTDHNPGSSTGSWFRNTKIDIAERLKNWIYGFISGETQEGLKQAPIVGASADPTAVAGKGIIYAKDPGTGIVELFFIDSAGNIKQLTSGGKLNIDSTEAVLPGTAVLLTGDQTIDGIKTFTSSPSVPSPTLANDVANKDYVDTAVAPLSSKISGFGVLSALSPNTLYQAATDGFVLVKLIMTGTISTSYAYANLYADSVNPPTTIRGNIDVHWRDGDGWDARTYRNTMLVPICKNWYWQVSFAQTDSTGAAITGVANITITWIPLTTS